MSDEPTTQDENINLTDETQTKSVPTAPKAVRTKKPKAVKTSKTKPCKDCRGTGLGQGDVDAGKLCSVCKGSGILAESTKE